MHVFWEEDVLPKQFCFLSESEHLYQTSYSQMILFDGKKRLEYKRILFYSLSRVNHNKNTLKI